MAPQEAEIQALMGSLVVVVAVKTVIDGPTPKGLTPNGPKKTREKVTIQTTTKRKTMLGIALQLQQKKTTTIIVNKQLNKQTNVSNSVAARARTTTKLKTNKTTEKRTNQHKLRH